MLTKGGETEPRRFLKFVVKTLEIFSWKVWVKPLWSTDAMWIVRRRWFAIRWKKDELESPALSHWTWDRWRHMSSSSLCIPSKRRKWSVLWTVSAPVRGLWSIKASSVAIEPRAKSLSNLDDRMRFLFHGLRLWRRCLNLYASLAAPSP